MKYVLCTAALLLAPGLAWADEAPSNTPEKTSEKTSAEAPTQSHPPKGKKTIVLTGEDEDLTADVAAELRAAGFEVIVIPPGGGLEVAEDDAPTVVAVRQEGDLVVVQATVVDQVVGAEVAPTGEDGMSGRDAAALRAAETIRHLVNAQSPAKTPDAVPAEATQPEPEPEKVIKVPSVAITVEDDLGADAVRPGREVPVFRLGAHGGVAALGFQNTYGERAFAPSWAVGLNLVGDVAPNADLRGQLTFMRNFDDRNYGQGDVWAARANLLAEWQAFGSDAKFTPVLGGGLYGEVMRNEDHYEEWYDWSDDFYDPDTGDYSGPVQGYAYIQEDRLMFNSGLTASAGLTAGRGFRFRLDAQASLQLLSLGGHDTFYVVPSAMITAGLDWDVVTTTPEPNQVARR